jgi:chromosome segregation protein
MYLKEVVINGFKSFADRTKIELKPGVTAIVGPNGCGKSNIAEAIRWVLGEQSAKSMRSTKMSDVIFQGTDKRKPLPLCEVTLTFTECEKELGTAFNEVEITRRISREGGGDYFLNGKPCRLKDIQRLFMDTGVGRESYSFMMQGQIDRVLSANPAERRQLFEEAAGITRYKSQRKEALDKLKLVDQNLARVTDVVEEVSRQMGTLKRQASKALRFKRLKHRLTHLDLSWQGFQYTKRREAVVALEAQAISLRQLVNASTGHLKERESVVTSAKAERVRLHEKLQEAQQVAFNLRSEKENAENQAKFAEVRSQDLRDRIAQVDNELAALAAREAELQSRLDGESGAKAMHAGDTESAEETVRIRQRELDEALRGIGETESKLRQERQDLLMAENEITRHRSAVTTLEVDLKSYQSRHADIANTVHSLSEQRIGLEQRLAETEAVAESRRTEVAMARQAVAEAQEESKRLAAEFRQSQQRIQELDRQVTRQNAQLTMLEQLHAKFEGFSDGAKAVLKGELASAPAGSSHPLNAVLTVTDEALAPALEHLLAGASEAIVLDDAARIPGIAAELTEKNIGKAGFLAPVPAATHRGVGAPEWLRPARRAVMPRGDQWTGLVDNLFAGCLLCDDLAQFLAWWKDNPGFDFLIVATSSGELVDRRGLIYGGRKAAKSGAATGFFQREAEIKRLRETVTRENDALTALNMAAMETQARMDECESEIESRRRRSGELEQELSALGAEERAARAAVSNLEEQAARRQRELDDLEGSQGQAIERMDRARAGLQEKESEIETRRVTISSLEQQIDALRSGSDEKRDAVNEVRFELAEKRQKLHLIDSALAEARRALDETRTRRDRRIEETEGMNAQVAEFAAQTENNRARAVALDETIAAAVSSIEDDRRALSETESRIESLDGAMGDDRLALRDNETRLQGFEVKLAEESSQCRFITDKVQGEYQLDVSLVDWKRQLWNSDEEFETKVKLDDLEDEEESGLKARTRKNRGEPTDADFEAMDNTDWPPLCREITELRERINSMGAVNLVAIEEYAELRERHNFLKTQSDDLWAAKNELTGAIDEINKTSQQLFADTFEQIRKNFKFTFDRLFNGGEADLQLIAADDPLDSGIEITARPPGTKLRSLTLLSGGQKTMTAVGLLFAIYMVKPSPFCVLDELDAPLDDANVGRFTDIVREFTKYSQFLVVTHNKRTVSAADTIYGVTMQERGVTKLFSMRFNKDSGDTEEPKQPVLPGMQQAYTMAR